ncbi:outer membrane beta-barrel protein [Rickettsiales bacterium]|nr:outer membrane beta-barrel protein [Rickettsiales bacterium]
MISLNQNIKLNIIFMKKLTSIAIISSALLASNAFAFEGKHSVGLDIINSQIVEKESNDHGKNRFGASVNYKYAIDVYDNFVITPAIFYDRLNANLEESEFDKRYGLKLDLGYKANEVVTPYFSLGYAINEYDFIDSDRSINNSDDKAALIYGVGLSFKVNDILSVSTEYNISEVKVSSKAGDVTAKADIDQFKVGLSYNF